MWVEAGEHAPDRVVEQVLVLDRLYIVILYLLEDLGKGAKVFEGQPGRLALFGQHPLPHAQQRPQSQPDHQKGQIAHSRSHRSPPGASRA